MQALGTDVEFRLVTSKKDIVEEQFSTLWETVSKFEQRFSRFRHDSELSQFNQQAGRATPVSQQFKEMLLTVKKFSTMTEGHFNPFVLPDLQRAGYIHSMTDQQLTKEDYSERTTVDCDSIEVGDTWAHIPENTALDFGGIGKGYLADHLATLLSTEIDGYCLSLGGDMLLKGCDENGAHWSVDIQSDTDRTKNIAKFQGATETFGIATSATIREKQGKKQLHQISTVTGLPVNTALTMTTVVAKDATTADVLASYILSTGEETAKKLIAEHTIFGALLQKKTDQPVLFGEGFSVIK